MKFLTSQLKLRRQKRMNIIRRRLDTIKEETIYQENTASANPIARSACVPAVKEFWTVPK